MSTRRPSPTLRRVALRPLRAVAFWTAVFLPLSYLPLLQGGLDGAETAALLVLALVNVAALAAGYGYSR